MRLKTEQIQSVIETYIRLRKISRVAIECGVSRSSVKNIIKHLKEDYPVDKRQADVDDNYFKQIDTEEKAYFLGLLYADGCVLLPRKSVAITLQSRDKEILVAFKKALNYTGNFHPRERECSQQQDYCGLSICSESICQDLINLGCKPRKSLTSQFPSEEQVPVHLVRHFIRGMIDGDGSVGQFSYKSRKPSFKVVLAGTKDICEKTLNIIRQALGRDIGTVMPEKNIFVWKASGNHVIRNLYKYLYDGATIFLTRKEQKMKEVFNYAAGNKRKSKYKRIAYVKNRNYWRGFFTINKITTYCLPSPDELTAYYNLCDKEKEYGIPYSNDPQDYFKWKSMNLNQCSARDFIE